MCVNPQTEVAHFLEIKLNLHYKSAHRQLREDHPVEISTTLQVTMCRVFSSVTSDSVWSSPTKDSPCRVKLLYKPS